MSDLFRYRPAFAVLCAEVQRHGDRDWTVCNGLIGEGARYDHNELHLETRLQYLLCVPCS